jgi:hypothetical protein
MMVEELERLPARLRQNYTHDALIDLLIARPDMTQRQIAAYLGYTESWLSVVINTDAFQAKLAARREEIVDPELKATLEERFRALAAQSLKVLQERLTRPDVSNQVVLRAVELGMKANGIGQDRAPPAPHDDRLERLAQRLMALQAGVRGRLVEGERVEEESADAPGV